MIAGDDKPEKYTSIQERARLRCMTPLDMTKEYQNTVGQKADSSLYADLIDEEYVEWRSELHAMYACEHNRYEPAEELKELLDLVYVIYGYANTKGWDLDEGVRRLHMNNMGRMFQDDGTIKRREDGKIIKRPGYPKVDLSDLV